VKKYQAKFEIHSMDTYPQMLEWLKEEAHGDWEWITYPDTNLNFRAVNFERQDDAAMFALRWL